MSFKAVDDGTYTYQTGSHASGGISYAIQIFCPSGHKVAFQATDERTFPSANGTQQLWSNTVTQTCF